MENGDLKFTRHGKGTAVWPNGDRFDGEFVGGKRHGQGVKTNKNGKVIAQGIWVEDQNEDENRPCQIF